MVDKNNVVKAGDSKETEQVTSSKIDTVVKPDDEKTRIIIPSSIEDNEKSVPLNEKTKVITKKETKEGRKKTYCLKKVTDWNGSTNASLDDEPFYHGYVAREEAERCLTKDGEFMVRKAVVKGKQSYIVSILTSSKKLHLKIQEIHSKNLYWLHTYCFKSIQDLIRYHQAMGLPIYEDNVILKSYVEREQWQLYHEQIVLGDILGSGEFGMVYKGILTVGLFTKPFEVAVKTLRSGCLTSDDRVTFLREANVMLKLQHRNVIRLFGVAVQKEPIMIVMEIATGGSLLSKAKSGVLSLTTKRKYCYHALRGMKYLEVEQVMHRDLAARNCLIDSTDTCKISDFGLSLLGRLHREKKMVRVPVRWLAPETLKEGTYSNKSDVWSYGVLMFEVFSNGQLPYHKVKHLREVRRKVLYEGLRLRPPPDMPSEDRAIMLMCFETDPAKRSSFVDLKAAYKLTCAVPLLTKMRGWLSTERIEVT